MNKNSIKIPNFRFKKYYGLFFLNFTGVPCILEDFIINEICASNRKPIMLIDDKYINNITLDIVNFLDIEHIIFNSFDDLFEKLASYKDKEYNLSNDKLFSKFLFNYINYFNSRIYYHDNQFQIESIKEDIIVNNGYIRDFFYYPDKINVDFNNVEKIIYKEDKYLYDNLIINKGNKHFQNIIQELLISNKKSFFVDDILNNKIQIGCLNQSCIDNPHLFNYKVYKLIRDIS